MASERAELTEERRQRHDLAGQGLPRYGLPTEHTEHTEAFGGAHETHEAHERVGRVAVEPEVTKEAKCRADEGCGWGRSWPTEHAEDTEVFGGRDHETHPIPERVGWIKPDDRARWFDPCDRCNPWSNDLVERSLRFR
jgi:hypothetical protein